MDARQQIAATVVVYFPFLPFVAAPAPKVGDQAPDFTLPDQNGKILRLSDFRGEKSVVLGFCVRASTPTCTRELKAYQVDIAKFDQSDTQVIGISVDGKARNQAFAKKIGATFPL